MSSDQSSHFFERPSRQFTDRSNLEDGSDISMGGASGGRGMIEALKIASNQCMRLEHSFLKPYSIGLL